MLYGKDAKSLKRDDNMSNYVCAVGDKMPSDPNEPVMDLLLQ